MVIIVDEDINDDKPESPWLNEVGRLPVIPAVSVETLDEIFNMSSLVQAGVWSTQV